MAKFFGNLNAVMIVGLIAAIALMFGLDGDMVTGNAIGRWLHLFFGVLWIGLLYYLNFVQVPLMPTIPDELKPAVGKHIAPKVLFYFRWAALLTVVTGLYVAWASGWVHQAMTLQQPFTLIGVGMWIAIVMAANVWFIIRRQNRADGLAHQRPAVTSDVLRDGKRQRRIRLEELEA